MTALVLPVFIVLLLAVLNPVTQRGRLTPNAWVLLYAESFLVLRVVADFVEPLLNTTIFSGLDYHVYWLAAFPGLKWLMLSFLRSRRQPH